jgi:enoyl-[acyl-carrier protein] reductase I
MNNHPLPLENKKALIFGVANERSLAWAAAQKLHEAGADIALTYLNDALERRVRPLGEKLNAAFC